MSTVIIASTNPVKIEVSKKAFEAVFPEEQFEYISFAAESGVPDQPFGDEQTLQGAKNRVAFSRAAYPNADFYVGQEGGVMEDGKGHLLDAAYIVIESKEGVVGTGKTATFIVPPAIAKMVRDGMELGHATDAFFSLSNSKHASGLIGPLTDEAITRTTFYLQAAIIALAQIKHAAWYLK